MGGEIGTPRWLIVVRRDRPELYENLRQSFELDARVRVILDRRQADRRRAGIPVETDRRRESRRQSPAAHELAFWGHAGFSVASDTVGQGMPSSGRPALR